MLEVVCAVVCASAAIVTWFLTRKLERIAHDQTKENAAHIADLRAVNAELEENNRDWTSKADQVLKMRSDQDARLATLKARADANCENVRNQGEILAEHREALDAIEARLPKPRAPRKRKKGTPADAILSVGGEPANDNVSDS